MGFCSEIMFRSASLMIINFYFLLFILQAFAIELFYLFYI